MTEPGAEAAASLAEMLDERQHLLEIASWFFGSAAMADQIVHETYRHWYALNAAERARIPVPRAWLTRVAGDICLDLLASHATPPTVADTPEPPAPSPGSRDDGQAVLDRHEHVVRRFAAACDAGDATALKAVLAANAVVVSDGGGKVRAPVHPTHGADAVARFVTALLTGQPRPAVTVQSVNGRAGLVVRRAGQAVAVISVSVAGAGVTAVWIVLNPDKLRRRRRP